MPAAVVVFVAESVGSDSVKMDAVFCNIQVKAKICPVQIVCAFGNAYRSPCFGFTDLCGVSVYKFFPFFRSVFVVGIFLQGQKEAAGIVSADV